MGYISSLSFFISILLFFTCLIGGFFASYNFLSEKLPQLESIRPFIEKIRIYLGLACFFIGFIAFFREEIITDLVPVVLSMACGLYLSGDTIFQYVNLSKDPAKSDFRKASLQTTLTQYGAYIGLAAIFIALLHIIDLSIAKGSIILI